jgi:hypothetical protein
MNRSCARDAREAQIDEQSIAVGDGGWACSALGSVTDTRSQELAFTIASSAGRRRSTRPSWGRLGHRQVEDVESTVASSIIASSAALPGPVMEASVRRGKSRRDEKPKLVHVRVPSANAIVRAATACAG